MTSEMHMRPFPRFLYYMIWYLQLVNFSFLNKSYVVSVQQFEADHVGYCCLSASYVCIAVTCEGQQTAATKPTCPPSVWMDVKKGSSLILFKGESDWIQSNENTILKTARFVCIDFMTHCEVK